jgi:hypothetical protein
MDLYPFNLVLAVAVASATLFLGYLPTRLLRLDLFIRQPLRLGAGWLAVAAASPPEILHYYLVLAILCFVAWWRLRGDHGLGGKLWLCGAAGLGISLGVVLILAVEPAAWPALKPRWGQALFLVSTYLGGAIIGLAYMLHAFTRPEASRAGVIAVRQANLLLGLIFLQAAGLFLALLAAGPMRSPPASPLGASFLEGHVLLAPGEIAFVTGVFILPILGWQALRKIGSPRPSAVGATLVAICLLGFITDLLMLGWAGGR